jgi:uncharacterized protein (TIGR03085 family)
MPWVNAEKDALVATLRGTDPDSPTLCEGWAARHLLAHLVQREQEPAANIKDQLRRRPPGDEKHLGRLADSARSDAGFQALLGRFVAGAPPWSPMSWAADSLSFLEYVIHHEDVRRGSHASVEPRVLPPKEAESIWKRLPRIARFSYRRAPVGVVLALPDGRRELARKGSDPVVLTGDPVELLLYLSGRQGAARVDVSGDASALQRFEAWQRQG